MVCFDVEHWMSHPTSDASPIPTSTDHADERGDEIKHCTDYSSEQILKGQTEKIRVSLAHHNARVDRDASVFEFILTLQSQFTTRNCLSSSIMKITKKMMAKTISQMATAVYPPYIDAA